MEIRNMEIHFNISDQDYFNQDRIGSSDLKSLSSSYWKKWKEPKEFSDDTKHSFACGKYFHAKLQDLPIETNKILLATVNDIKEKLKELKIDFSSTAKKDELISLLESQYPDKYSFKKDECSISDDDIVILNKAHDLYIKNIGKPNGYMEVAIFGDLCIDGKSMPIRAKIDIMELDRIIDLKTTSNFRQKNDFAKDSFWFIKNNQYYGQFALYMILISSLKESLKYGSVKIFGDEEHHKFLDQFKNIDHHFEFHVVNLGAKSNRFELPEIYKIHIKNQDSEFYHDGMDIIKNAFINYDRWKSNIDIGIDMKEDVLYEIEL